MQDPTAKHRADAIDALLPQTQCGKCGYPGCRPYAEAIARGEADIDQCPPGGDAGVDALAALLGRAPKPLNPAFGLETPPVVAWIDEAVCIGCTRCIQACPVDAILGAAKLMHTVIAAECTGCELCLAPCPVECIHLIPVPERAAADPAEARQELLARAAQTRARYQFREQRLARDAAELAERRRRKQQALHTPPAAAVAEDPRKAVIAAALERARLKKAQRQAALRAAARGDGDEE